MSAWPLVAIGLLCVAQIVAIGFCLYFRLKIDRTRAWRDAEIARLNAAVEKLRHPSQNNS